MGKSHDLATMASDGFTFTGAVTHTGTVTGVGGLKSTQVFTSNGTYTKPSGVSKIRVYVTGGGGGGGGYGAANDMGAGGGAGATAIKLIDVTSITSETVNICLLYTSPSPRDQRGSGMASSA